MGNNLKALSYIIFASIGSTNVSLVGLINYFPSHVKCFFCNTFSIVSMFTICSPQGAIKQINRIFKDLLWGFDKGTRCHKTSLVAWYRMTQPWDSRGLGLKDCMAHSKALLSKWVTKAIDDPQS